MPLINAFRILNQKGNNVTYSSLKALAIDKQPP